MRLLGTAIGLALLLAAPAEAGTVTVRYTGAGEHAFTVPAGVTSVHIDAAGARGDSASHGAGGRGGLAIGDLTVTPGQVLYAEVGVGGGSGGHNGASGGGASDVRTSPAAAGGSLDTRLIVGAGGGGGGGGGIGGAAGGDAGTAGAGGSGCSGNKGGGGGAGTAGAGGSAGTAGGGSEPAATAGSKGQGGAGGGALLTSGGGGGGAGGYYGGGGGGVGSGATSCGGGGGGGSNYTGGVQNGASAIDLYGVAYVQISYDDTTAPAVTLSAPLAVTGPAPSFSGALGSADGDDSSAVLEIFSGASATGSPVRRVDATVNGTNWTATVVPGLGDGTYTARVRQDDDAGNTGFSTARTFTVDATAPALTLTTPADGSVTSDSTPTIAGTGGVASGDLGVSIGAFGLTASVASGAGWSTDVPTPLADGVYSVSATQSDSYGNTATTPTTSFRVDTTAPAVAIASPGDRASFVQGAAGVVSYTCADGGSGVDACTGTVPNATLVNTSYPGTYAITVTGRDGAGNTSSSTVTYTVTAKPASPPTTTPDKTAPKAKLSGVPKSLKVSKLLKGVSIGLSANERASFAVTLIGKTASVKLARVGDVTLSEASLKLGTGTRKVKLKSTRKLVGKLKKATVTLRVVATDAAGNHSTVTKSIKIVS